MRDRTVAARIHPPQGYAQRQHAEGATHHRRDARTGLPRVTRRVRGSVCRPLDALRGKTTGTKAHIRQSGQTQEHESERNQPGEHTQRRQRSGNQIRRNRIERHLTAHRQNQRGAPQGCHDGRGEHFRAEHRHDAHEQANQRRTQQNQRGSCRHRQGKPYIHGEVRGGKQTHQHRGLQSR